MKAKNKEGIIERKSRPLTVWNLTGRSKSNFQTKRKFFSTFLKCGPLIEPFMFVGEWSALSIRHMNEKLCANKPYE